MQPEGDVIGIRLRQELNAYEIGQKGKAPYNSGARGKEVPPYWYYDDYRTKWDLEFVAFEEYVKKAVSSIQARHETPAIILVMRNAYHEKLGKHFPERRSVDFVFGKGFTGPYDPEKATASESFLADFKRCYENATAKRWPRKRISALYEMMDTLPEWSAENGLAAHLRGEFGERVEALEVFFVRKSKTEYGDKSRIEPVSLMLASAVKSLELFRQPIVGLDPSGTSAVKNLLANFTKGSKKPPEEETQPPKKEPAMKRPKKTTKTETEELPVQEPQPQEIEPTVTLPADRLEVVLAEVQAKDKITTDKGKEIEFKGKLKTVFVKDVKKSFPVVQSMVTNLYDTGKFFKEVRDRQKENGLWIAFTETIGVSRRTLHSYIQVVERLGETTKEFSFLGVTKLLSVSQIKEPVPYLQTHAEEIAKQSTREVHIRVLQETGRTKKPKQENVVHEMGNVRIVQYPSGRTLKVTGLTEEMQKEALKLLLEHFSSEE